MFKEKIRVLREALNKIANIDYRGNAHESSYIAKEALKQTEEVKE